MALPISEGSCSPACSSANFVATETADGKGLGCRHAQRVGDRAQEPVPGGMAPDIVDALEPVQIDEMEDGSGGCSLIAASMPARL